LVAATAAQHLLLRANHLLDAAIVGLLDRCRAMCVERRDAWGSRPAKDPAPMPVGDERRLLHLRPISLISRHSFQIL
jgi:hypothetical protein